MASQPRANLAALRTAVQEIRATLALANITVSPSPRDGEVIPDLPRMYHLNDERLKEFLPGTILLTNNGETRYVPVDDAIREHAGGYQFRVVAARRPAREQGWSGTVYYSRTAAENAFQAAILGVGTEPRGNGRLSELVRDNEGKLVALKFATEPADELGKLETENSDGQVVRGSADSILGTLNLRAWEHFPSRLPVHSPLPTQSILERTMVPWSALEEASEAGFLRGILSSLGFPLSDSLGVSAFLIAALLKGATEYPDVTWNGLQEIRVPAAAIAATVRAGRSGRPSTRSTQADLSHSEVQKIRTGKTLLKTFKTLLDALTPAQIARVASSVAEGRDARAGVPRAQYLSKTAYAIGKAMGYLEDQSGPMHNEASLPQPVDEDPSLRAREARRDAELGRGLLPSHTLECGASSNSEQTTAGLIGIRELELLALDGGSAQQTANADGERSAMQSGAITRTPTAEVNDAPTEPMEIEVSEDEVVVEGESEADDGTPDPSPPASRAEQAAGPAPAASLSGRRFARRSSTGELPSNSEAIWISIGEPVGDPQAYVPTGVAPGATSAPASHAEPEPLAGGLPAAQSTPTSDANHTCAGAPSGAQPPTHARPQADQAGVASGAASRPGADGARAASGGHAEAEPPSGSPLIAQGAPPDTGHARAVAPRGAQASTSGRHQAGQAAGPQADQAGEAPGAASRPGADGAHAGGHAEAEPLPGSLTFFCRLQGSRRTSFTLTMDPQKTIGDVADILSPHLLATADRILFVHRRRVLRHEETLADADVTEEDTLYLKVTDAPGGAQTSGSGGQQADQAAEAPRGPSAAPRPGAGVTRTEESTRAAAPGSPRPARIPSVRSSPVSAAMDRHASAGNRSNEGSRNTTPPRARLRAGRTPDAPPPAATQRNRNGGDPSVGRATGAAPAAAILGLLELGEPTRTQSTGRAVMAPQAAGGQPASDPRGAPEACRTEPRAHISPDRAARDIRERERMEAQLEAMRRDLAWLQQQAAQIQGRGRSGRAASPTARTASRDRSPVIARPAPQSSQPAALTHAIGSSAPNGESERPPLQLAGDEPPSDPSRQLAQRTDAGLRSTAAAAPAPSAVRELPYHHEIGGASQRVAHHCRFNGTPFEGLVPPEFSDANPATIVQRLALSLGFTPDDLADALKGAIDRKKPNTQLLLAPIGLARTTEQAAFDYQAMRDLCGMDLPASHDTPPHTFAEAAGRLRELFAIAAEATGAPSSAADKAHDDDKSRAAGRRRMQHVSASSEHASGAVPARHLDYLASEECRRIEEEATRTQHERDAWQEVSRICSIHGVAGWAVIFSNGMSLERSADDGRIPGRVLAARENLIEAIKDLIVKVCLGPSQRLRESMEKQITKVVNGIIYGEFDLKSIVAVMGASPSLASCAEAGAVAGDPSMGRPGSMKETLQTDMPKALSRFSDLLLTVHHRAGDSPRPPLEGLRLTELWHGASGLPLETTKLADGITEVVGSLRLIEVALTRLGRAMRERRRTGDSAPVDFQAEVAVVIDRELSRAADRQAQYSYVMAASGRPKQSDNTHTNSLKRSNQTQQQTDSSQQNQNDRKPKRQRGARAAANGAADKASGGGRNAAAPANAGGGHAPRREEWMTFRPGSITHTVGKRTGPDFKPNVVCAGEQLLAEDNPNTLPSERPCIWHAIFKGGCKKGAACQRCQFRLAQVAAGKATPPIPAGMVAKLKAACTPAIAELLK